MKAFQSSKKTKAAYAFVIEDKKRTLLLECQNGRLDCRYSEDAGLADVTARLSSRVLEDIMNGKTSFQGSFMRGDMAAKGDFALIRLLDELFVFT